MRAALAVSGGAPRTYPAGMTSEAAYPNPTFCTGTSCAIPLSSTIRSIIVGGCSYALSDKQTTRVGAPGPVSYAITLST